MINLRYHIVSITAVFLALGIGITMGSTFLGRGALERIDRNVKNAQEQVRRTNKENAELKREVRCSDRIIREHLPNALNSGTVKLLDVDTSQRAWRYRFQAR